MPEPTGTSTRRKILVRGMAALLPTLLTIFLLVWAYQMLDKYVGQFISENIFYPVWGIEFDEQANRLIWSESKEAVSRYFNFAITILSFLMALVLFYTLSYFFATLVGYRVAKSVDRLLHTVPIVKNVYPHVKQVTDFFLTERTAAFSQVVAIEYPRKGMYSIGFITGHGYKIINEETGTEHVNIFIPSCPTPVTGYVIFVPKDEVIKLPISVDEAFRFFVSGGVLIPRSQIVAMTDAARAEAMRLDIALMEEEEGKEKEKEEEEDGDDTARR